VPSWRAGWSVQGSKQKTDKTTQPRQQSNATLQNALECKQKGKNKNEKQKQKKKKKLLKIEARMIC